MGVPFDHKTPKESKLARPTPARRPRPLIPLGRSHENLIQPPRRGLAKPTTSIPPSRPSRLPLPRVSVSHNASPIEEGGHPRETRPTAPWTRSRGPGKESVIAPKPHAQMMGPSANGPPLTAAAARERLQPMLSAAALFPGGSTADKRRPSRLRPISSNSYFRPIAAESHSGSTAAGRHDWSPPILRPFSVSDPGRVPGRVSSNWCAHDHRRPGTNSRQDGSKAPSFTASETPGPAKGAKQTGSVQLLFDSVLNCYYDPKTNKYFELR